MFRTMARAAAVGAALVVAACGETEVSDVSFGQVREAMAGDGAGFDQYFPSVKGKAVRWTGRVTESARRRGDDFVEEGHLFVDMDEPGAGSEDPDVTFQIPVSAIDTLKPGDPVTYVAIIREFERTDGRILLKLELKSLQ